MAILRTEKPMMRATSGVKIIEKRRSQELISLLGSKDTLDGLARASGVRWYGHVLRRDNGDVLKRALNYEVAGRGRGRPNMTWKRQVEKHTNQIGLKKGRMPLTERSDVKVFTNCQEARGESSQLR